MREYGGGGGARFNQERHKATCSKCEKECEVPFKPVADRPVYCRECYREIRGY